jgi:ABC-type transporter Mla MlaB component
MKKINITVIPIEPDKNARILLEGEWTVKQTIAIHQELIAQIDKYESVEVVLQQITSLDITGIQLLYAIRQSAIAANKQCRFELAISHELEQLLAHTGFAHLATQLAYVTQK